MLRALLKKQMLEMTDSFVRDRKTGKRRVGGAFVGVLALYGVVFLILLGAFFTLGAQLCAPLCEGGLSWLYFAIMGLVSAALGLFGSVFNTYSSLYQAKDNDLLLSMPIPPGTIILVRLLGVYLMGLMYSSLVMLPAIVVYYVYAARSVTEFVFPVLLMLLLSLLVLALSCLLGWVVAQISARLKNRSLITVLLSLIFVAVYYYAYFKATEAISTVVEHSAEIGARIKGSAYPVYLMGRAGAGEAFPMLLFAGGVTVLLAIVYLLLSRTFFGTVAVSRGVSRRRVRGDAFHARGMAGALFSRELDRFISSPTYMLNCGLGALMLILAAAFALIKGGSVAQLADARFGWAVGGVARYIRVLALAAVCLLASSGVVSAPSVSLEGRTLWQIKSLPIPAWPVLRAKLELHLAVIGIPALVCAVCVSVGLRLDALTGALLTLTALLAVLAGALTGLAVNLKAPLLEWKDETAPIKQSTSVMVALFGGWLVSGAIAGIYFAVAGFIGAEAYIAVWAALLAVSSALLLRWMKKRGAEIFEAL